MMKNFGNKDYIVSEGLNKKLNLFYNAGLKQEMKIPCMVLKGVPGSGKTSLAERFASEIGAKLLFTQAFPGMGSENLIMEPNLEGVLRGDSQNAISKGLLIRALEATINGPTVVVLDELDKARAETDSFLLDFLNSGRVTTGTREFRKGNGNLWVFITTNEDRDLSAPLLNRSRVVTVDRLGKEDFLNILGLEQDHYLGAIYEKDIDFSIRQAKEYLDDISYLDVDIDIEVLSQYVDFNKLEISSIEEVEKFSTIDEEDTLIEFKPELSIYNDINTEISYFVGDFEMKDNRIIPVINQVDTLVRVKEEFDYNSYEGWFEVSNEVLSDHQIIWGNSQGAISYGIAKINSSYFKLVANKKQMKVFLNGYNFENSLEAFFGEEREDDDDYDEYDEY